jgi:flagellar M-ring protein FliF
MVDDDPSNPNPALIQSVQTAVNAAAGIDTTRGDVLSVTALAFNRDELVSAQASMTEAAQKDQLMSYARIGALALGPLLMIVVLFFMLGRGRKKTGAEKAAMALEEAVAKTAAEAPAAPTPIMPPSRPGKPAMAQPIAEDPQRAYIREQIQALGKSNPATVAQLIQTWMDEDRRN